MERFILVDHSLSAADGHHFEYAVNVLSEAEASGYQPILVANQRFRRHAARLVPSHWEVIPLYRYSAYHRYSQESLPAVSATGTPYNSCSCVNLRDPKKSLGALFVDSLAKLGKHLRAVRDHLGKWKRVRSFARHTRIWWKRIDPNPHDIVFFPTFTSFDLVCLVKFLAALPESSRVTWHLQFHFDFLCDEVETGKDHYFMQTKAFFEQIFQQILRHRLVFYTTTEPLAQHYNQLRIGDFTCLPYPVSPQLGPAPPRRDAQPISVACVGCLRPEKGYQHLQGVVDRLWQTHFATGRARLMIQANGELWSDMLSRKGGGRNLEKAIVRVPYPLAGKAWRDVVRSTDVALFPYDRSRYRNRCSALLLEMLASGKPVIVPAGCWLADQISEPTYRYQEQLLASHRTEWLGEERFASQTAREWHGEYELSPSGPYYLAGRLGGSSHAPAQYVQVRLACYDERFQLLESQSIVVGRGSNPARREVPVLFRLPAGTRRVRLSVRNAFVAQPLCVDYCRWWVLCPPVTQAAIPLGSIGLTFSEPHEIARLLDEILTHFDHYRAQACAQASYWQSKHHPQHTLRMLQARQIMAKAARLPAA